MSKVEVMRGSERRRWTDEQKRQILAEAFAVGGVVAHVARRVGVRPGQLYRWRNEAAEASRGFAKVIVAAPQGGPQPPMGIEIDIRDIRVRIGPGSPRDLVASVLDALVCR
jgi:transposase